MQNQKKTVNTLVISPTPSLEEIVSLHILKRRGSSRFPGIAEAGYEICPFGKYFPDNKARERFSTVGKLCVGVLDGIFGIGDEPLVDRVVGFLGLHNSTELRPITGMANPEYLEMFSSEHDLSHLISRKYRNGQPVEEVIKWAFCEIDFILADQKQFVSAMNEFKGAWICAAYRGPDGANLCLGFIESDNSRMATAGFHVEGSMVALVQKSPSTGHIKIFGNKKFGVDMTRVAYYVRCAELEAAGKRQVAETCESTHHEKGQLNYIPNWYFEGVYLFNGGPKMSAHSPTLLPNNHFKDILVRNLSFDMVEYRKGLERMQRRQRSLV